MQKKKGLPGVVRSRFNLLLGAITAVGINYNAFAQSSILCSSGEHCCSCQLTATSINHPGGVSIVDDGYTTWSSGGGSSVGNNNGFWSCVGRKGECLFFGIHCK